MNAPKVALSQAKALVAMHKPALDEKRNKVAAHLRDTLGTDPRYAAKAAESELLTGDPMTYWNGLAGSQINLLEPRKPKVDDRPLRVEKRLRDSLSSDPLHAAKAKELEILTGDPMAYWKDLVCAGFGLEVPSEESSPGSR